MSDKLAPIFSAAHISKWDALPEEVLIRGTKPGFKLGSVKLSNDAVHARRHVLPIPPDVRVSVASHENMAHRKTHTWITLWFLLTAPVIIWDATYCFFRPRSMIGGDLHWIWEPYGLYQNIDYVYGVKALEENNGFTNAQSLLNLVEMLLDIAYVYLAHMSSWAGAPLIGFAAATMTLSKTVLYWAQEYYCGACAIGHNTWDTLFFYWIIPNGLWLVFPSMIVCRLGRDIVGSLSAASQKATAGKTE